MYRWYQWTGGVTLDISVPPDTKPDELNLALSKRTLTLSRRGAAEPILRRKTFKAIMPAATKSWTMPAAKQTAEHAVVRIILYKDTMCTWTSPFEGDPPWKGFMDDEAESRAAAEEARARAAGGLKASASSRPFQTWRHGCRVHAFKAAGGMKHRYVREPPVKAEEPPPTAAAAAAAAAEAAASKRMPLVAQVMRYCETQPWREMRRPSPFHSR